MSTTSLAIAFNFLSAIMLYFLSVLTNLPATIFDFLLTTLFPLLLTLKALLATVFSIKLFFIIKSF